MGGWEAYTEKLERGGCYKGAVVGQNGKVWAHTKNFKITPEETLHLVAVLQGDSFEALYSGFSVAGKPYAFTRGDFNFEDADDLTWFIGRHKSKGKMSEGMIVILTERALVFGLYNPAFTEKSFGSTLLAATRLAQTMIAQGY